MISRAELLADHEKVEQVALAIYSAMMASGVHNSQFRMAAHRAFESSLAFLEMSQSVQMGDVTFDHEKKGVQPAECWSTRLPKMHPMNLVSQRHRHHDGSMVGGDLAFVAKVYDRIKGIVKTQEDETGFEDTDLGIQWTREELLCAQQIFPAYVAASN